MSKPRTLNTWTAEIASKTTGALCEYLPSVIANIVTEFDDSTERAIAELDIYARRKAATLKIELPEYPIVFVGRERYDERIEAVSALVYKDNEPYIMTWRCDPRPIWRPNSNIRGIMSMIASGTLAGAIILCYNTHDYVFRPRMLRNAGELVFGNTPQSFGLQYNRDDYDTFKWGGPGYYTAPPRQQTNNRSIIQQAAIWNAWEVLQTSEYIGDLLNVDDD